MAELSVRDRAFARLLVATVLRRLGQIDALIADCLNTPLAPRAAIIHDILRLGIAQLLFLRTPPHAAVATSVDLAHARGFLSHKGLVNAVLRRLSVEGPARVETQDAARLNTPDWLWQSWAARLWRGTRPRDRRGASEGGAARPDAARRRGCRGGARSCRRPSCRPARCAGRRAAR